jgi:hypothetical protein
MFCFRILFPLRTAAYSVQRTEFMRTRLTQFNDGCTIVLNTTYTCVTIGVVHLC